MKKKKKKKKTKKTLQNRSQVPSAEEVEIVWGSVHVVHLLLSQDTTD